MLRLLVLTTLVLAAPTAVADAGFRLDARTTDPIVIDGEARLTASAATLDLAGVARGAGLELTWARAHGEIVWSNWTRVQTGVPEPLSGVEREEPPSRSAVAWGGGSLGGVQCGDRCLVLVFADADARFALDAHGGRYDVLAAEETYWVNNGERDTTSAFQRTVAAGTLTADLSALREPRLRAAGTVELVVADALLEVDAEGAPSRLDLRRAREALLVGERVGTTYLHVVLEGATLIADGDGRVFTAAPSLALDGTLALAGASGEVTVEGRPTRLDDAALRLEGIIEASLFGRAPATEPLLGDAVGEATVVGAGTARAISVDGADALAAAPRIVPVAAVSTLLALLLGLTALYTRLNRSRLLDNANRRRMWTLVRDEPGLSASDIAQRLGLARVVVQHHARHLVTHRMLATRTAGRSTRYFIAELAPGTSDWTAALALSHERATAVMLELSRNTAGLTQRDLQERLGVPRRTVAYHLDALARAGLIRCDGRRPQRYRAPVSVAAPGARPPEERARAEG